MTYEYNAFSQMTYARDPANQIIGHYYYLRPGRLGTLYFGADSLAAGASSYISSYYENDGDMSRRIHGFMGSSPNVDFKYSYDGTSRLTAEYVNLPGWMWSSGGAKTTTYAMNDLDQYTYENGSGSALAMGYDARGTKCP